MKKILNKILKEIIEISSYIKDNSLLYDMTSENFNNLMDKGIYLLPFNLKILNDNYSEDIYEYLIKEYSSFFKYNVVISN